MTRTGWQGAIGDDDFAFRGEPLFSRLLPVEFRSGSVSPRRGSFASSAHSPGRSPRLLPASRVIDLVQDDRERFRLAEVYAFLAFFAVFPFHSWATVNAESTNMAFSRARG